MEEKVFDLEPVFTRLVVKPLVRDKIGSIYIPDKDGSLKATEGEVLAVGQECEMVKVGDWIFYGRYSGAEIERNGNKYVIMNEEDILAFASRPKEG